MEQKSDFRSIMLEVLKKDVYKFAAWQILELYEDGTRAPLEECSGLVIDAIAEWGAEYQAKIKERDT